MMNIELPWIECWEQMPKSGDEVLAYGEFGINLSVVGYNAGKLVFYGTGGEVTHWCPVIPPFESYELEEK